MYRIWCWLFGHKFRGLDPSDFVDRKYAYCERCGKSLRDGKEMEELRTIIQNSIKLAI